MCEGFSDKTKRLTSAYLNAIIGRQVLTDTLTGATLAIWKGKFIMKKVFLIVAIMTVFCLGGCTSRENADASIKETSSQMSANQSIEMQVGENEVQESSQVPEMTEKDSSAVIQYGDTIQVSLKVSEQKGVVEELGTSEIVVADTSKEFQPEYAPTEEVIAKNVEKAIGKYVGDTFTLWYEGGDGRYAYEYTILEIMDKPADKVAYGDIIQTSYLERTLFSCGVDPSEGPHILETTGEREIFVSTSDYGMDLYHATDYDRHDADRNVALVIGKGVGDTFRILSDQPECTVSYEYTINEIHKAVEYGDRIKVSCRKSSFLAEGERAEFIYDGVEFPVWSEKRTVNLEGHELSESVVRELFHELMGKRVGEYAYVADETVDVRTVYSMEILDVYGQPEEVSLEQKAFWMAEEDEIEYLYSGKEKGSEVIIHDRKNEMLYAFYIDNDKVYWDECETYIHKTEYNEQGQLIWEYEGCHGDATYEYQYDSKGMWTEMKKTYSDGDVEYHYFNPDGSICREEYSSDGFVKWERLYESGIIKKIISYETDGSQEVVELDEWGLVEVGVK